MRQTTISNYIITYPESIVYLYDNNVITVQSNHSNFDTKVTITAPNGSSNLQYRSKSTIISFILDDNIKYLYQNNEGDWVIDITIDNVQLFSFSFHVINGKSFLNKTHGSSNVIYHYTNDDIELFSPNSGKVVCGNETQNINDGYNAVSLTDLGITQSGEYTLSLQNRSAYQPTTLVLNDIAITPTTTKIIFETTEYGAVVIDGGSLWSRRQIYPTDITLYYEDVCEGDIILRYTNCDGCHRQVAGKLIQEEDTFTPTKLNNVLSNTAYRFNPAFVNNNNSKILKIGINDIDGGAELGDIIFSDKIEILDINNNWTSCILKTNSIKNFKNGGFDNLEIEIIVSEL